MGRVNASWDGSRSALTVMCQIAQEELACLRFQGAVVDRTVDLLAQALATHLLSIIIPALQRATDQPAAEAPAQKEK